MDGDGEIELNEFIGWIILLLQARRIIQMAWWSCGTMRQVLELHVTGPSVLRMGRSEGEVLFQSCQHFYSTGNNRKSILISVVNIQSRV